MWFQTLQVVYSRGVRRYQLGMEGREGKMNKDCKCTLSMQSTVLMCTVQCSTQIFNLSQGFESELS